MMRRIIIAPDSFKESLSAQEVAAAIDRGIKRSRPDIETVLVPLSDGGEGLLHAVITAIGGVEKVSTVTGPLGESVEAYWGVLSDQKTAVIEMAQASGLDLVPPQSVIHSLPQVMALVS